MGNCYILEDEKDNLILECGITYKEILIGLDFDLSKTRGCLCSHSHLDHARSAKELMKHGIDIYVSEETSEELGLSGYRLRKIEPLKQFKIGNFTILPFPLNHDVCNLGYLITNEKGMKLAFLTDTAYCQYNFTGVTDILIECNCSNKILMEKVEQGGMNITLVKRILKSHFSLENVIGFLKANDLSKVKNIVLIHLSDSNSNAKEFKAEVEKETGKTVYVAEKGMEIEL